MITDRILSDRQKTLKSKISFSGIGLHTGINAKVCIYPAPTDTGVIFIRTDKKDNNKIHAIWTNVSSTKLSTTISNKYDVSVATIEHLMSALSGMHIDNAIIEINAPEVPIMDGSSEPFVELIEKCGSKIRDYRK